MGKEKDAVPAEKTEDDQKDDEEDILYTHKPDNRVSSIQWNPAFCRRPSH